MNMSILKQSMLQMWGMIVLAYKYQGNLPSIENYHCAVKYALPFQGKWVVANGGVTQQESHSWDIPTQRYAYDFILLDDSGKSFCGDETQPTSFYCYGQDILAPADGIVAEVGNGNPDSQITPDRTVSCTARDLRGNYVLIRHTEHEYGLLAHLRPNSIEVSVGQQVTRGEKIARCGNTGNTSEPHLHFQLQAGRSFFTSPGLPIVFENITATAVPNYRRFDDRTLPEGYQTAYLPYITRGQLVGNC